MQTDYRDNILTAYIDGEIDHDRAAGLRMELDALSQSLRPSVMCLDFGRVGFMDSSGVGLVLGRYRQQRLIGGRLRVVNIPPSVYRVFAMSGLEALGVLR